MAVVLETTVKRFRGLSTDEKPGHFREAIGEAVQAIPVGSVFTEVDTGERYVWGGSWPWVRQEQTIESVLADLVASNEAILAVLRTTHLGHERHLWEREVEDDGGL